MSLLPLYELTSSLFPDKAVINHETKLTHSLSFEPVTFFISWQEAIVRVSVEKFFLFVHSAWSKVIIITGS